MQPLRLLLCGYGLALALALALGALGGGLLAAGLTLWLGGAAATLALGAAPAFRRREPAADDAEAAAASRSWSADGAADAAAARDAASPGADGRAAG